MTPASSKTRSPLYWLGFLLLVFGATSTAVFLFKQFKESAAGHTHYGFIATGIILALIGLLILAKKK